jgi:hypothetical protein
MAIWACQAGKDVYVEKPCSHSRSKAADSSRRREIRPHRPARHATAHRSAMDPVGQRRAQRKIRQAAGLLRLCQPDSAEHRHQGSAGAAPRIGLRSLAGSGARASVPHESRALRLALAVGFRQRRDREHGVAQLDVCRWAMPDGARRRASSASAVASATRTRAKLPTPS